MYVRYTLAPMTKALKSEGKSSLGTGAESRAFCSSMNAASQRAGCSQVGC